MIEKIIFKGLFFILLIFLIQFSYCQPKGEQKMNMSITSSAFYEGGMIPEKYTCEGKDISPSLTWTNVPTGSKSLALICDDPDAPMGTWVHWVMYNIPPSQLKLDENVPVQKEFQNGTKQGVNGSRRNGYNGPCPPGGTHRYFFKLYALNKMLELEAGATKSQLLNAMEGHILGNAQLMGKYKRK
jgi:Raf kinase inhibitor-like YbhB/YbcL family protein